MKVNQLFEPAETVRIMRLQIGLIAIGILLVIGGNVIALTNLPRYIVNPPSAALVDRHVNDERQACELAGGAFYLEHLAEWRCTVPYVKPYEPWFHPAKEHTLYMLEQDLIAPMSIIAAITAGLSWILAIGSVFRRKQWLKKVREQDKELYQSINAMLDQKLSGTL